MKKKISLIFTTLVFFLCNITPFFSVNTVFAQEDFSAAKFVTSVYLSNDEGIIGTSKINDDTNINVLYDLSIPDGTVDISQPYILKIPDEIKYATTTPILLYSSKGILLGEVNISNGLIRITFFEVINTLNSRNFQFSFWSSLNKNKLDYINGNNLLFPNTKNENNFIHLNFNKANTVDNPGENAISKTLKYNEDNIVTWTILVNKGGYTIENAIFFDTMINTQDYILGSTIVTFKNYNDDIIEKSVLDLIFFENENGSKTSKINFGTLAGVNEEIEDQATYVTIKYKTKMKYNPLDNKYQNSAFLYSYDDLVSGVNISATYHGQSGSGEGNQSSDIIIKYVDENGNNLADNLILTGNIGESYKTELKEFDNYIYKGILGEPTGIFSNEKQDVTYIYKKKDSLAEQVIVKYVDESGKSLAEDLILTGNIGEGYKTELKEFDSYIYKEILGESTGIFSNEKQDVTYIYKKKDSLAEQVIVKYVDESGKSLAEDLILTGNTGKGYKTELKEFDSYVYKEILGEPTGIFSNEKQYVTYVYKKNFLNDVVSKNNTGLEKQIIVKEKKNFFQTKRLIPSNNDRFMPKAGEKKEVLLTLLGIVVTCLIVSLYFRKICSSG